MPAPGASPQVNRLPASRSVRCHLSSGAGLIHFHFHPRSRRPDWRKQPDTTPRRFPPASHRPATTLSRIWLFATGCHRRRRTRSRPCRWSRWLRTSCTRWRDGGPPTVGIHVVPLSREMANLTLEASPPLPTGQMPTSWPPVGGPCIAQQAVLTEVTRPLGSIRYWWPGTDTKRKEPAAVSAASVGSPPPVEKVRSERTHSGVVIDHRYKSTCEQLRGKLGQWLTRAHALLPRVAKLTTGPLVLARLHVDPPSSVVHSSPTCV